MISRYRASALLALALSLAVITPTAYAGKPSGGGGKPGGGGSPPTYPPARHWQSMGASEAGGVYMFGGDSAAGQQMNDLWYFSVDSGQWTLITPTSRTQSLYGRKLASLTCGDGQCVLFGGLSTKVYNEAWYFSEPTGTSTTVTWSKVSCSNSAPCPSPRYAPLTAFDPTQHYRVSFGGIDGNYSSLGDTWILNEGRWSRQAPQQDGPAARGDGSTTFVPGINRVVMFGGHPSPSDPFQQPLCDLWTWNGSAWEEVSSSGGPCLVGASAGWDGSRIVVTGGFTDSSYLYPNTDTWYFEFSDNGGSWTMASRTLCAPLSQARGAYDSVAGKFVFFGGYAHPTTFDDTLVCQ